MPLGAHKAALFGVAGVSTASVVLLSTAVASSDASIEFTLPTAYKEVKFGFYNIHPSEDATFGWQVNADGETGYNETITSTFFRCWHREDGTVTGLSMPGSEFDQGQETGYQYLTTSVPDDNDSGCCGELFLFSPASTTYVKHFQGKTSFWDTYTTANCMQAYTGGYINTTTNLSEISFKFLSGNVDAGTIKMWGVK
jgi:hypothetical protein